MATAFAAVNYYLLWDLRVININSFYLVLVLLAAWCWQKDRPTLAGLLFAVSVSVKIYSIVFSLYLLLRKEWRVAWAMAISLVLLFVAVPVLCFGWHDAISLSRMWINVLRATSRRSFASPVPPTRCRCHGLRWC